MASRWKLGPWNLPLWVIEIDGMESYSCSDPREARQFALAYARDNPDVEVTLEKRQWREVVQVGEG